MDRDVNLCGNVISVKYHLDKKSSVNQPGG